MVNTTAIPTGPKMKEKKMNGVGEEKRNQAKYLMSNPEMNSFQHVKMNVVVLSNEFGIAR